jgi:predicted nucleotidyltransferase
MLAIDETIDKVKLDSICRAHRVRYLALFGSSIRGESRPLSDIDLLVEYEIGFTPTFFALAELSDKLRPLFGDREIDLALPADLHWFIRDEVMSSARTIYER